MNDDLQKRAKRILEAVADLPQAERNAAIERECGDDEPLKSEVRSLLAFWSAPTIDWVTPPVDAPTSSGPTRTIGPYRVIREIGRGGMGVVYLAKREGDQFRRSVALKVLKRGMDSEDVLRRFELERQVLAAMNHPGIARLYDAGETEEGTPYFVMEYVEGTDIATYCDTHRLHISERLEIFRKVCEAVHSAHQNLVVHRDLKPSNIIMTEDGQPKLLDFGIAKIINPQFNLVEGDPTAPEFRVMTPEYASPEQVRGDTITTASDVYSLGVLLYQLVSGHPPYRIRTRVREELVRVICDTDPERPSTAVIAVEEFETDASGSGGTTTITPKSVGAARDSRPQHLRRVLAGDIDNMVMKAMRKEPQRRYTSVQQFGEDIGRYFSGLPVIARPDTLAYRVSKFVNRNRAGVATAAAILVLLVSGSIAVALAWKSEKIHRAIAQVEAERARFNRDLVIETLDSFGTASRRIAALPGALEARRVIAETVLGQIETLSEQAHDDPVIQRQLAAAHQLYGDLNDIRNPTFGDSATALRHYHTSLDIRRALAAASPDDAELLRQTVVSHINVASHLRREGEAVAAIELAEQGVALGDRLQSDFPEDARRKRILSVALKTLGDCHIKNEDVPAAIPHFERSLNLCQALAAAQRAGTEQERTVADRDLGVIFSRLGGHLWKVGRVEEAREFLEKNVAIREELVARSSKQYEHRHKRDLVTAQVGLADFEVSQERFDSARPLFERAIADTEKLATADPTDARLKRDLGIYRDRIARLYFALEDWPSAITHLQALLQADGQRDPEILSDLASAYHENGQRSLAVTTVREALGILEGKTDADSVKLRTDLEDSLREYSGQ